MTNEHKSSHSEAQERDDTQSAEDRPAERERQETTIEYRGDGDADVFGDENAELRRSLDLDLPEPERGLAEKERLVSLLVERERLDNRIAELQRQSAARRDGNNDEVVILDNGNRDLSRDQRDDVKELDRLYQSLCGGQPGLCWPGSLLDATGGFSRPSFPALRRK
ncbi:hypothetical protein GCT19_31510 [Paraburkholderia sp. CNPSo 3155]|uniref:hypothetical protein n=1 Tax=Paraburkholderia TaxID=1822464 RepID=UPI00128B468C|nr:hypothetical protein [Paraburkholderia atlantica]MPW10116.1 hypothetical protein [Paraburkholderia atlantica]